MKNIIRGTVILLMITCLSAASYASSTSEKINLYKEIINNMEYTIDKENIKLKDGKYEPENHMENNSYQIGKMAFGDLNGDGQIDAIVEIIETWAGSGHGEYLAVILNLDNKPLNTSTQSVDHHEIKEIIVRSGKVTVNYLNLGPKDPQFRPTVKKSTKYRYDGKKLIIVK